MCQEVSDPVLTTFWDDVQCCRVCNLLYTRGHPPHNNETTLGARSTGHRQRERERERERKQKQKTKKNTKNKQKTNKNKKPKKPKQKTKTKKQKQNPPKKNAQLFWTRYQVTH